jgi:type II secretory pathway pseudopilin PulG
MIVIAIIGTLAVIGIISYNGSQAKARDLTRKSNVQMIASALTFYHTETKSWKLPDADDDSNQIGNNNGQGFLNRKYPIAGSPISIASYLINQGYLKGKVADPLCASSDLSSCTDDSLAQGKKNDYMIFSDGTRVTIYTHLENSADKDIDQAAFDAGVNNGSPDCSSGTACGEGMNYAITLK